MLVTMDTLDETLDTLRQYQQLSVDLETTGLDVYPIKSFTRNVMEHGDNLCGIAVCGGDEAFYFPFLHGEGYNLPSKAILPLKALLVSRVCTFWNAKFDLKFLHKAGFPHLYDVEDVMLAAHLMNENEKNYQLKSLGDKYINPEASKEQDILSNALAERGLGKGDMWQLSSELVAPYAEQDVLLTQQLREFYGKHLVAHHLYELWIELNDYLQCILAMEERGMLLDLDRIYDNIEGAVQRMEEIQLELDQAAGYDGFKSNSPKQVNALLGRTGTTAVAVLEKLDDPLVKLIIEYRRNTTVRGRYYLKFQEFANEGVLHPNLFMVGTVTGRFSSSKPNLQATPRKLDKDDVLDPSDPRPKVKEAFIARPGYSLVAVDYKQAEVYLAAHYANAVNLLQMIRDGGDIHAATAQMVGIPRFAAKRMNFAMQYGIAPRALASDLDVSVKEATKYLKQYKSIHPEMSELYYTAERTARRLGHIKLFTGRMRRYGNRINSPHRKASSNLIQGGVAELMRISSTRIHQTLGEYAPQLLHVHDEQIFEVRDCNLEWVIPAIVDIMTDFDRYNFQVKFRVDVSVGKRWSELKEWK